VTRARATASLVLGLVARLVVGFAASGAVAAAQAPANRPVIVVETTKGTFSFETYPREAQATVAHVVALVRRGFYDGQRVHRAVPGFVVQFGDPRTRDETKRDLWGVGVGAGSGSPVGVVELHKTRRHQPGAVGLAHMGDPAKAESQIYITLADRNDLDGRYVVFGQVTSGTEVPGALRVGDEILRVFVRD
jgi:cyclophilin family peptidyl-prolyl cis-trans isomerase